MMKPDAPRALSRFQWEANCSIHLELAGHVLFPAGCPGTPHSHPFWELIFIGAGSGFFQREKRTRPCVSDEILLIRPGENHRFQADARTAMEQLYLGFSFAFDLPDSWNGATPEFLPPGPWTDLIRSELRDIHARVREHGKNEVAEPLQAKILQVISRVVGVVISGGKGQKGPEHQLGAPVPLAKEYILSHLHSRLSVPELAREFCLSPKYFGEIFKRTTGTSVREFQQQARMLRARQLLAESSLSVTEIAAQVGIENLPYFSRLFKSQFRISPRQARQKPIPAGAPRVLPQA